VQRARRRLLAAALLSPALAYPASATLERWTGAAATPPIDLLTPDGKPFSLAQLRGKVVLVNFWATWCEPCVTEMPSLQKLRDTLGADRFEVLAVNYMEGPARIKPFVDKLGLTLPVVRDTDGAVAKAWGARVFPVSYVVDRDGRIRYVLVGGTDWTSADNLSKIRALVGPTPQ
jgi:thiol-disulfide isomerase/thioredoxin